MSNLVKEFFEDYFTYDSKAFRSFIKLLLKPGYLTEAFNKGRRVRYIPPLRMYIIVSIIYFFLLSIDTKFFDVEQQGFSGEAKDTVEQEPAYSITANEKEIKFETGAEFIAQVEKNGLDAFIDSIGATDPIEKFAVKQGYKLAKNSDTIYDYFLQNFSIVIFFLMPVFAGLLHLFFRKNRMYYIQHLIFSFHLHSFIFLLLAIQLLSSWLWPVFSSELLIIVLVYAYTFKALKNIYGNSTGKTFIKSLLLIGIYDLIAIIFLALTFIVSVLLF